MASSVALESDFLNPPHVALQHCLCVIDVPYRFEQFSQVSCYFWQSTEPRYCRRQSRSKRTAPSQPADESVTTSPLETWSRSIGSTSSCKRLTSTSRLVVGFMVCACIRASIEQARG